MLSEEKKGKSLLLQERITCKCRLSLPENGIFFLLGDDIDPRASAIDELRQLGEIR